MRPIAFRPVFNGAMSHQQQQRVSADRESVTSGSASEVGSRLSSHSANFLSKNNTAFQPTTAAYRHSVERQMATVSVTSKECKENGRMDSSNQKLNHDDGTEIRCVGMANAIHFATAIET